MCSAMLPARERCWLQVFAVEARYEEGPFPLPASREELLALLSPQFGFHLLGQFVLSAWL